MGFLQVLWIVALAGVVHGDNHEKGRDDDFPSYPEVGYRPGKMPKYYRSQARVQRFDADVRPADLRPPKNDPGDVIDKTDHKSVDTALNEVLKHVPVMGDRACAVGVANIQTRILDNPRWYMASGLTFVTPPYEVHNGSTSLNLFHKKTWELAGSAGVLSYDISGSDHKVAIMFSVPFDWNIFDVWFNMKVYPKSFETGEDMFDQMYYFAGPYRAQGWEQRTERGVEMTATMTESTQSKIYVSVDTTDYSPEASVETHYDCEFNMKWLGSYCWKECGEGGWCWINSRCDSASDCQKLRGDLGELECHTKC